MDFRGVSVADVARRVRDGETTAREQIDLALSAIDRLDGTVHAFVAVDAKAARADADRLDERIAAGEDVGPLAGVPLAVKDLEEAAAYVTSFGSALHAGDEPASEDSILVQRLKAAGCVVVGKTNTPEFGWKADTTNQVFPGTGNPWNPERSAGGSSGGSGAALAAGMVPLATGSDGGGSIRIPSAVNGLSGLKPSLGRVPSGGPKPPGWLHFSTKGPMARTIADVALALDAVVGPDPTDLHSLPMKHESWHASLASVDLPRAVLWSPDLGYARVDSEVASVLSGAVEKIAAAGVEVHEVEAFEKDPVGDWVTVAFTATLAQLRQHRGTDRWEQLDPGLTGMIEWAAGRVEAPDVVDGINAGHRLNLRLVELFHRAPLLLAPVVAGQTGLVGGNGTIDGDEDPAWVSCTYPINMTRNPAGSVCAGFTADGMPVGLQVIGPQHADAAVLRAIAAFETVLDVDTVAPLDWAG